MDYVYDAELVRVVDGDTFDFVVDLGFNIEKKIRVRLKEVDTHEIYGVEKDSEEYRKGMEQKQFVENWFDDAGEIAVETFEDDTGKYGRYLAKVRNGDGVYVSDELMANYDIDLREAG